MPIVTILAGGFALNNNPPPSSGSSPNMFLPLLGVGLLPVPVLLKTLLPLPSEAEYGARS